MTKTPPDDQALTASQDNPAVADLQPLFHACDGWQLEPLILALPSPVSEAALLELIELPQVSGIMSGSGLDHQPAITRFDADQHNWQLPPVRARAVACPASRSQLKFNMVCSLLQQRIPWLVYRTDSAYQREHVVHFLGERLVAKVVQVLVTTLDNTIQRDRLIEFSVRLKYFFRPALLPLLHGWRAFIVRYKLREPEILHHCRMIINRHLIGPISRQKWLKNHFYRNTLPVNYQDRCASDAVIQQDVDYVIRVGEGYLERFKKQQIELDRCRILELGPGINFGSVLFIACFGASPAIADRFPAAWNPGYHPAFYTCLAETIRQRYPAADTSPIESLIAAQGYPEGVIIIIQAGAESMADVADECFDIIISNAVFEHLVAPSKAFSELCRITAQGGYGFHMVDFRDHRDHSRPLDYLLLDPCRFEILFRQQHAECGCQYRPVEIGEMLAIAGFSVIESDSDIEVDAAYFSTFLPRLRSAEKSAYRNFSEAHLKPLSVHFTVKKC